MRKASHLVFISVLFVLGTTLHAQILTQSPYSRFGMGQTFFQGFADQQAMGQTGTAMRSPMNMYLINPASYSALTRTNFKFGARSFFGSIAQGDQKLATNGAALNYFALGFQVNKKKNWGFAFGATPYSSLSYNIVFDHDSTQGNYRDVLSGSGGITRYFLGTGKTIGTHFSVGANVSFLHGQTSFTRSIEYPNTSPQQNYRESSTDFVRGFMYEAGAQYYARQLVVKENRQFDSTTGKETIRKDSSYIKHHFGVTYSLSTQLNNDRTFFARTYVLSGEREFVLDTVLLDNSQKGKTTLPSAFGFGYMLSGKNDQWRLALDYRMQRWSEFRSPFETQNLTDAWQGGIGFAWRPSVNFYDEKVNYLAKAEYRLGARYGKTYMRFNETDITDLGISFGIGLPLRTRTVNEEFKYDYIFSSLDISVEYLQRGTLSNNLIKENYWRFVVGVSLNDKWFNKRKIE